ncbi:MAG: hypothetical protein U9R79_03720 [Armatimonadota bacterium]|nr:hypothetical protein [Armatimonadota bacterium]
MSSVFRMDWGLMVILMVWMLMVLAPLMAARVLVAPEVGQLQWIGICLGAFLTVTLPRTFMLLVREREEALLLRPRWAQLKWDLAVVFLTATIVSSVPPPDDLWRSLLTLLGAVVGVSALMGLIVVRRPPQQPTLFDHEIATLEGRTE